MTPMGMVLTSLPLQERFKCEDCRQYTNVPVQPAPVGTITGACRDELKAKGYAYPRTCPTCKFGPCTKKPVEKQDYSGVWRHDKTGGLYQVICEAENEGDLTPIIVYQNLIDKRIWVRPRDQFLDGRFSKVGIL